MNRFSLILTLLVILAPLGIAGESEPALPATSEMTPPQRMLLEMVPLAPFESNDGLTSLTGLPNGAGNAAEHYAKLEMLYAEDRVDENSIAIRPDAKGIREILKAVGIRECKLSPDYYPLMTSGTAKQPDMIVYMAYTNGLLDLAKQLESKGDIKHADAIYRSCLIFGWHLTQNPPSLLTDMLGISIKAAAAKEYAKFLQRKLDMDRSIKALEFAEDLERTKMKISRKSQLFLGNTTFFNCLYATARVAMNDPQDIWRQEAILRLGVLRHGAPDATSETLAKDKKMQEYAEEVLAYIAENDKKPWIRELAVWTIQNVTPDRFENMRRVSNFYEQKPGN